MTSPTYEWSGDYFCGGCIVHTITEHEPFTQWIEDGNTIGDNSTPMNLQMIREFLTEHRLEATMPRRLRQPPQGVQICATCLNFFTIPDSEEQHE